MILSQKTEKTEKLQKNQKNISNVRHFLSYFSAKNDSYPKLPILFTKQLKQRLWTPNFYKCHKKLRNRNGIQKQIQQKKL